MTREEMILAVLQRKQGDAVAWAEATIDANADETAPMSYIETWDIDPDTVDWLHVATTKARMHPYICPTLKLKEAT